jgi:glycogen operon protein
MIAFRKAHPSLSRSQFWRDDVRWYGVTKTPDLSHESRALAFCLRGRSQQDDDLYVMLNASEHELRFGIHEGQPHQWRRVIDTARPSPQDILDDDDVNASSEAFYASKPRSVVVLLRASDEATTRPA